MKQIFDPENFFESLTLAICNTTDFVQPVTRLRKRLTKFPQQQLHIIERDTGIQFRSYLNGAQRFLPKSDPIVYELARKRYLEQLLRVLELLECQYAHGKVLQKSKYKDWKMSRLVAEQDKQLLKIKDLVMKMASGNLDIARIVLTPNQYNWYTRKYNQKRLTEDMLRTAGKPLLRTKNGILMRSKSEQKIGNLAEKLAVPYHYEEQMRIYVWPIVQKLENTLNSHLSDGSNLFFPKGRSCYWNVPKELAWMNASGSIWKTFELQTGKLTIYNDFKYLFSDDSIGIWEHEGLEEDFKYRTNANERASIMLLTNSIRHANLIETTESEVNDDTELKRIFVTRILPKIWF